MHENEMMETPSSRTVGVSVVIPVWNGAQHIVEALKSVEAQSIPVEEIVVVDDASTDDTAAVVEAYARSSKAPIKLHRMPRNGGASAARNLGVAKSSQPIVAFLDADDIWHEDKLELQLAAFADASLTLAGCGYVIERPRSTITIVNPSPSLAQLARTNLIGTCSNAMVRRSAFLAVGGFDETLATHEDWLLFLSLAAQGRVEIVQKPLVRYRSNHDPNGRLSKHYDKTVASALSAMQKMSAIVGPDIARQARSANALSLAFKLAEDFGDLRGGLTWYLAAIRYARSGRDVYDIAKFLPKLLMFKSVKT